VAADFGNEHGSRKTHLAMAITREFRHYHEPKVERQIGPRNVNNVAEEGGIFSADPRYLVEELFEIGLWGVPIAEGR